MKRDRHDGPQVVELGERLAHPCPDCGSPMVLRFSSRKLGASPFFYGCTSYPRCRTTHGAHPDGMPLGVPAGAETRAARIQAHEAFDRLWKGPRAPFSRHAAYTWLADVMCIDELHIGDLDARRCAEVVSIVSKRYGYLFK